MNQKIPDKLFFKIGEVAKLAGVEQHVLRYWEDEFEALQPKKNKSGQRFYEKKDVDLILKIQKLLYLERYTIAGAKKKMRENGLHVCFLKRSRMRMLTVWRLIVLSRWRKIL